MSDPIKQYRVRLAELRAKINKLLDAESLWLDEEELRQAKIDNGGGVRFTVVDEAAER